MPSLKELRDQDLEWIISDAGDLVTIISRDGSQRMDEVPAIIRLNVEETPPYGYEKTLSTKHHEVTILQNSVDFLILNGSKVSFDEQTFVVHYVLNPERNLMTLYVR
jgi:hypothetical protein